MARVSPGLKDERTQEMIQQTWMFLRRVMRDERGAAAIEYGLLAALIAVAFFAGAQLLGTNLGILFTNVGNFLATIMPIGGGS
jgi:pilus assembly protein Flp/PilA